MSRYRAGRAGRTGNRIVWLLIGSFCLTVASFIASTVLTEHRARGIAAAAQSITTNALPSISCVSGARTQLRQAELKLNTLVFAADPRATKREQAGELEETRNAFATTWAGCLAIPVYEGERAIQRKIEDASNVMNASIDRIVASMERGDKPSAVDELISRTRPDIDKVDALMVDEVNLNARESSRLGEKISALRRRTQALGTALMIASAVLATLAAGLMCRVLQRFTSLMEARVTEMEHFAGRVAHDIRSPLAAVSLAIEITKRDPQAGVERGVLDRASRTLQRIAQLVDGLLVFARAGAPPPEAAKADVRDVIADVVETLRPAAEANAIELTADMPLTAAVACTPGVLVSIVSNLVGNAIKYMGTSPVRRVQVNARDLGSRVRIEVRDTGPGVSPEQSTRLFEPYARGAASTVPGIGLGLATVRRLTEAHGGAVGFHPNDGSGSVFWFELPKEERRSRREIARTRAILLSRLGLRPSAPGSP